MDKKFYLRTFNFVPLQYQAYNPITKQLYIPEDLLIHKGEPFEYNKEEKQFKRTPNIYMLGSNKFDINKERLYSEDIVKVYEINHNIESEIDVLEEQLNSGLINLEKYNSIVDSYERVEGVEDILDIPKDLIHQMDSIKDYNICVLKYGQYYYQEWEKEDTIPDFMSGEGFYLDNRIGGESLHPILKYPRDYESYLFFEKIGNTHTFNHSIK